MKRNINLTDDLDSAFNKAIEPMEITPSQSVWEKVDAGLTRSENLLLKKKNIFWKRTSIVLSSFITAFGIFFFYHFKNHTLPNPRITSDKISARYENQDPKQNREFPVVKNETSSFFVHESQHIDEARLQKRKNIIVKQPLSTGGTNSFVEPPPHSSDNTSFKNSNKKNNFEDIKEKPKTKEQNIVLAEIKSNINVSKQDSVKANEGSLASENSPNTPKDSVLKPSGKELLTETSANNVPKINSSNISRIYLEGIFSPELTNQQLKDNDSYDNLSSSDVKEHEHAISSLSAGIRIGYDFNKWSIQSGCIYNTQSLIIKPNTIYADLLNGHQYTLVTSNGTVEIPTTTSQQSADSMKIKDNSLQTLGFLCVPLQLKYRICGKRLSFYVSSGVMANILVKEETDVNIEGEKGGEDNRSVIRGINGIKNIYYGYSLGVGMNYRLRKGLYCGLEPTLRGSMSSINKNTPMKTYPYSFGVGIIIGYHF